jgi:molybdopterin converting factor small subunit
VLEFFTLENNRIDAILEAADPVVNEVKNVNKSKLDSDTTKNTFDSLKDNPLLSKKNIINIIKNAIDQLKVSIRQWLQKLKNRIRMLLETNQGYMKQLQKRQQQVQPVEALKIKSYTYHIPMLEKVYNNIKASYTKNMELVYKALTNINNPNNKFLEGKNEAIIIKEIMQAGFRNNEVETPNQFFAFLKEQFRGKATEKLYRKDQLPTIIKLSDDYEALQTRVNNEQNAANRIVNMMESLGAKMRYQIKDQETLKVIKDLVKVATKVRSFYDSFISYYIELRIEQMINYRTIVKKFYQF